jgi:hypothetical protein
LFVAVQLLAAVAAAAEVVWNNPAQLAWPLSILLLLILPLPVQTRN